MKEYTDRFKGFQIRDITTLDGTIPKDRFDLVYWDETGDKDRCYSIAFLVFDKKEAAFDVQSVGLRTLTSVATGKLDEDVAKWVIKWCEYKAVELDN